MVQTHLSLAVGLSAQIGRNETPCVWVTLHGVCLFKETAELSILTALDGSTIVKVKRKARELSLTELTFD